MKANVMMAILGKLPPNTEIAVPCGVDAEDGQVLWTEKIKINEMVTSEASGIAPDGTPTEAEVPMIILAPEDGPWGDLLNGIGEEDEDEEEDDSESWKKT